MSTMVERVARAMVSHLLKEETDAGNYVENDAENPRSVCLDGYFDLKALARAAIEAMTSPTDPMIQAGVSEDQSDEVYRDVPAIFTAMIQAALKENA